MSEIEENDPLQLLKQFSNKDTLPELIDSEGKPVSTLREATYIKFDNKTFDKNTITNFRSAATNELLPLSVLYHATVTKKLDLVHYNEDATNEKFPTRLGFVDRRNWLDFLKGIISSVSDLGKGSLARNYEKRPFEDVVDSEQQLAAERRRKRKAEYEKDKLWRENYQKTKEILPKSVWESVLESKAKDENYSLFIQIADDFFLKTKKEPQDRSGHSRTLDSNQRAYHRTPSRTKTPRVPIILVPSAPSAFITMYNVKELLQDERFEDQLKLRDIKSKRERIIQITHKGKQYDFTDTADNFQDSDWDRVVCVITDGNEWPFKKYKWKTPQETFKHVPGIYFQYYGDDVKKCVKTWRNVKCIDIHRELRHRDPEAYMEFWNVVERAGI